MRDDVDQAADTAGVIEIKAVDAPLGNGTRDQERIGRIGQRHIGGIGRSPRDF